MFDNLINSLNLIISQTQYNSTYLLQMLILLWVIFFITSMDKKLVYFLGIRPRQIGGLPGIILPLYFMPTLIISSLTVFHWLC